MEDLLSPTSIVGCSVSLLFCLGTAAVLGCFRERTRPLLIKQQFSFALMLTNIIVLAGMQGSKHEAASRVVTCLLHYSVIACFCWLCIDQHYILTCARRGNITRGFVKVAGIGWAVPVPFALMVPALGLSSSSKLESKFYSCWDSDHVIWSLVVPCACLLIISLYMLLRGTMLVFSSEYSSMTWQSSKQDSKSAEAMKYSLKTNFVMLILTTTLWVFGGLIFWYPTVLNYQLMFGLGHGLQEQKVLHRRKKKNSKPFLSGIIVPRGALQRGFAYIWRLAAGFNVQT